MRADKGESSGQTCWNDGAHSISFPSSRTFQQEDHVFLLVALLEEGTKTGLRSVYSHCVAQDTKAQIATFPLSASKDRLFGAG